MREQPTWRIPLGVLLLVLALGLYAMLVARYVAPLLSGWNALMQFPVYVVLGIVWIAPLRRFLQWMETGRWR
ncbi:MAG: DUF2842 domain-containing protein [Novosphingobium sp.]